MCSHGSNTSWTQKKISARTGAAWLTQKGNAGNLAVVHMQWMIDFKKVTRKTLRKFICGALPTFFTKDYLMTGNKKHGEAIYRKEIGKVHIRKPNWNNACCQNAPFHKSWKLRSGQGWNNFQLWRTQSGATSQPKWKASFRETKMLCRGFHNVTKQKCESITYDNYFEEVREGESWLSKKTQIKRRKKKTRPEGI